MLELPVSIWLVDEVKKVLRAVAFTEQLEKIIGNAEIPLNSEANQNTNRKQPVRQQMR